MTPRSLDRPRPTIAEVMALIVGVACGCWLAAPLVQARYPRGGTFSPWIAAVLILAGVSAAGPPLLIPDALTRRRSRWGAGRIAWAAIGSTIWLIGPKLAFDRLGAPNHRPIAEMFLLGIGVPTSGLGLLIGLAANRPRRRIARSWKEALGLCLALCWACAGLWALFVIYANGLDD